ncbi:GMC family oxidoreductase [Sphingopyxis yananensis]|uniref:GMC family oxidoreductase n=1 Tax=Sphingopyxis yananensis TaxID=2886687 RepID=UPI001D11ECFF|nr:GMC family oxidoreductase N-terminal domain-containing protein [Sphingopyxis yananensis]MCC2602386.1 GMC family oxidoreductase N-terminal domain-containing protein [Sphingopyxis yananensis]
MSAAYIERMGDQYDYIIVGAGSAGCIMANRLSENPAHRVLLIEAGGADRHPFIHMPKGLAKIIGNLKLIWPFMTEAEPASNNAGEYWARGRTLGGSSAINGMMYVRGQASDYDALAEQTSADWDWAHMGAAYKSLEQHELGAAETRGDQGPLHVTMPTDRSPLTDAAIAAGVEMGYAEQRDVNDPSDDARVGYAPRTIYRGKRESAATAFLHPIRSRPNLTVVTGVVVDHLLFDGRRVAGVRGTRHGASVEYWASRDTILTAGALATPAILQRSGIGPAGPLSALGIDVVQDAPEVGANLREHRGIVMQWRVRDKASENRQFQGWRLVRNAIRYALCKNGPMASAAYEIGAWFKLLPDSTRLDSQFLIAPYTFDYDSPKLRVEPFGGINICAYMLRPASTGTVMIRTAASTDLPVISPRFATATEDRSHMLALMRHARDYVQQSALAPYVIEETRPGSQYQSDDELAEAHRRFGYANYHACGTCRMGQDDSAPIDPRLRVRGVDGLRVADTSVFPFMLAGNTQAPAMALAWRGADLILEDAAGFTAGK